MAEPPEKTKPSLVGVVFLGFVALAAVYVLSLPILTRLREEREAEQRRAIAVLPAGVADAYEKYVRESLVLKVRPVDGGVLVKTRVYEREEAVDVLRFVPSSARFYMECRAGVEATFASGAELVALGFLDYVDMAGDRPFPPLGVPLDSTAARNLFETLCRSARQELANRSFVPSSQDEVMRATAAAPGSFSLAPEDVDE